MLSEESSFPLIIYQFWPLYLTTSQPGKIKLLVSNIEILLNPIQKFVVSK